jgi:hypothetical protein
MPPRRRAPAPLPVDIEGVRLKLAEGKIVRVGISKSAQFPDGATGRVRHVGDPATDGEEFVQVELSLNGMRDILPFTPADLTPATRGRPTGSAPVAAGSKPEKGSATPGAGPPGPGNASTRTRGTGPAKPARTLTSVPTGDMLPDSPHRHLDPAARDTGVSTTAAGAAMAGTALPPDTAPPQGKTPAQGQDIQGGSVGPADQPPTGGPSSRSKQVRGPRRTPAVIITIATTDTEPTLWKIEARVGARVALRSGSVAPARVWELVRLLENEALTKAVGSILDDQRKAAQARADALTAELAQVRAELDALPDGSS